MKTNIAKPKPSLREMPALVRAHSFNAAAFAERVLGFELDPKQREALATHARTVILNCARQFGKSLVAAAKLVHIACTRPGSVSVIVSENLAQTAELFIKIDRFLNILGIEPHGEPGKLLARVLPNGSRILGIAAREEAVRCYTADFVFVDEASYVDDEVYAALEPIAAIRDADCWLASTPHGRRGFFYETWLRDDPSVFKVKAPWTENPRLSERFIAKVRRTRSEAHIKQEYECEFVENGQFMVAHDEVWGLLGS